jgi:peptidyl-dipeptidase Dcp
MNQKEMNTNPFFEKYGTPYEVPAFDKILNEHYMPAFLAGMAEQNEEVEAITNNQDAPDFQNTIVALDQSGLLLAKVSGVFYNLTSANTSDSLQAIAKEVAPLLSQHRDDIRLNEKLFERVKAVYEKRENMDLTDEDDKMLEKVYKQFTRGGANLEEQQRERFREINKELSVLSLQFGDNQLAETNSFKLFIEDEEDLSGLPGFVINAAADAAREAGEQGKWLFTLHKPSLIPFLQYSDKRELRKRLLLAYASRCNHDNEFDNKEILSRMAALRVERANLLGYDTHADYILEENMARKPDNVYALLDQVWEAALPVARKEASELQKLIDLEGGGFQLEAWDWWYYAEKLKKQKYDLSDEEMKPYFRLENVKKGMFDVATKLYGITFKERDDIPRYHEEVITYEVLEEDGTHIGILLIDFFPRASKESGAWMNSYRKQYRLNGSNITPIITMVMNFTKPTGDMPSLLTFEEVSTMFHEFGHALHGLLSNCTYRTISGTSVPRDFVELPSQIMENWCSEPEVLKSFAIHYKTGEVIPDEMIEKMKKAKHFNQGFATVEYTAAAYLDMDWHTLAEPEIKDVNKFEKHSMEEIGLIPQIIVRYRSPYFAHIFAGGYSSGYYSYMWSEVLDADAFEAFKENGLFDRETAKAFRANILARGGSDDPMDLYVKFRGKEPDSEAMLRRKGLM